MQAPLGDIHGGKIDPLYLGRIAALWRRHWPESGATRSPHVLGRDTRVKTLALTGGVLLCSLRIYHLLLFEGSA